MKLRQQLIFRIYNIMQQGMDVCLAKGNLAYAWVFPFEGVELLLFIFAKPRVKSTSASAGWLSLMMG